MIVLPYKITFTVGKRFGFESQQNMLQYVTVQFHTGRANDVKLCEQMIGYF